LKGWGGGDDGRGGLKVMVGLEREVMERLMEVSMWRDWTEWRCD